DSFAPLRRPAVVLGALVLWGGLSAVWSIAPERSLALDARLAGLFAGGVALAAAAGRITAPLRLARFLLAGATLALLLALTDLGTSGGLAQMVSVRHFNAARLNQIAAWLAILALPIAALLWCRGQRAFALIALIVMVAVIGMLDGTSAKLAFT